ncbi:MAG: hypothetical protein HYT47_03070 [Candidatus Vogelbacteria bacterium]|nr:hypothetical protein [Candidatus Vogelbacteria bacterium]
MRKLKPGHIVLKSDEQKKFSQPGAIELLRKLANDQGWTYGFMVFAAAKYFEPKMPADVTSAELEAASAEIISRGKREKGEKGDGRPVNDGRLPLDTDAQANWDPPVYRWKGAFSVNMVQRRFAAEIKDGVDLTTSMLDAFKAELVMEKARVAELVSEHDDSDAPAKFPCGVPSHRGENEPFTLQSRHLLFRNDARELTRMRHAKGDGGEIIAGDVFVLTTSGVEEFNSREKDPAKHIVLTEAEIAEGGRRTIFCKNCRMAALDEGREEGLKLTFYTWAGAVFDGRGTRRQRDWHNTRRPRG